MHSIDAKIEEVAQVVTTEILDEKTRLALDEKAPYPNLDSFVLQKWTTDLEWSEKVKQSLPLSDFTFKFDNVTVEDNHLKLILQSSTHQQQILQLSFFQNGVVKFFSKNTQKDYPFSFEHIEGTPALTPFPLNKAEHVISKEDHLTVETSFFTLVITYKPFTISFSVQGENILTLNSKQTFLVHPNSALDFKYNTPFLFGLTERPNTLLLRDTTHDRPYRLFNNDIYKYPIGIPQGLYGNSPFIIGHSPQQKILTGLFWQNCSETLVHIKIDDKLDKASKSTCYWLSEAGNLEFYLFIDNNKRSFFNTSAQIMGYGHMPQYWTLGYHQCRWSYESQKVVNEINQLFNKHQIPCESITVDIDHTDEFRYFTWNKETFPDPEAMQNALAQDDRKLIAIADPHLKIDPDWALSKKALEDKLVVIEPSGVEYIGKCWPGKSHFLDFINPKTQELWASMYKFENYKHSTPNLYAWNDMNEPAVFEEYEGTMPRNVLHKHITPDGNEHLVEHRLVHNIYGLGQAKATYRGLVERHKDNNDRPHVLSRSFFTGSQKYTAVWTADTLATWDYLKVTVPMLLQMALCGFSLCGGDVGGFLGDPKEDLSVRWFQLGAFMPFFRGHSSKWCKRREPWAYEKWKLVREAIDLRYSLLPYWYTVFQEYCSTGIPVIRPLWVNFSDINDIGFISEEERFMVGEAILVTPILSEGEKVQIIPIVEGLHKDRWFDSNFTEIKALEQVEVELNQIPFYLRGGSIVPTITLNKPFKSSVQLKREGVYNLSVLLDNDGKATGNVYIDDGSSFDYKTGNYYKKGFVYDVDVFKVNTIHNKYEVKNLLGTVTIAGLKQKPTKIHLLLEGEETGTDITSKVEYLTVSASRISLNLELATNFSLKLEF